MASEGAASLVDSNVLLDVLTEDPGWRAWSAARLADALDQGPVVLNPIVYAEDEELPMSAGEATWAEIVGYRRVLTYVMTVATDPGSVISEAVLGSLHFMLLEHDLSMSPGRYRPSGIYMRDDRRGVNVYEGPDADLLQELMRELAESLAVPTADDPLVRAAMAHLNLVMIHPFRDGNGRMARALQTMVLAQDELVEPAFSSIEEWLGANTRDYYDVLAATGRGSWQPGNDATLWVKFHLRAHHMQAQTMRRRFDEAETLGPQVHELVAGHRLPERVSAVILDAVLGLRVTRPSYVKLTQLDESVRRPATSCARPTSASCGPAVSAGDATTSPVTRSWRSDSGCELDACRWTYPTLLARDPAGTQLSSHGGARSGDLDLRRRVNGPGRTGAPRRAWTSPGCPGSSMTAVPCRCSTASMDAALAIRTTYTRAGRTPPYADHLGPDGLQRYQYRGADPQHHENRALRRAMQDRLPLIWFVGVASGLYEPIYPVYVIGDEPTQLRFALALDEGQRFVTPGMEMDEPTRRYVERVTRARLHQRVFREQVLLAYTDRCTICLLRRPELLDAAHIVGDADDGEPVIPNGLAMCKIHHAAFDRHLLGVTPDHAVEVNRDLLAEHDGPLLRHGLQDMRGRPLHLPTRRAERPNRAWLAERYERFRAV